LVAVFEVVDHVLMGDVYFCFFVFEVVVFALQFVEIVLGFEGRFDGVVDFVDEDGVIFRDTE
jgi:hypothetical protein